MQECETNMIMPGDPENVRLTLLESKALENINVATG